ncbi:Major Facilitator Superfamily protein [Poriferisphaera corsica]|uniref:Major Facilitator Superfamily protein n=1 Tax=Poriferisphaera corsica TaxID=2528020 RepID=A0A517YTM2_9BACT|nr:MFS transporter [Poriferisphaera corsica]QDU33574.1 Major Facilitator Superfamily protein [Poriferisphaera corsica]
MSCNHNQHALLRALKAYTAIALITRAYFWASLFILFFSSIVTLKQVFLLEAIYYTSVFLLEVPSGYFSDKLGRKRTLLIGSISLSLAYASFTLAPSFLLLAVGQIFLAAGFAFFSGTDTTLHYALLASLNLEKSYGQREASLASNGLIISASAAIIGGLLAWVGEYRLAYAVSFLFAFLNFLIIAFLLVDPEIGCHKRQAPPPFLKQLRRSFAPLAIPNLRFLFIFTVGITVLNHVPYEFYQVYFKNYLVSTPDTIPLYTAIHTTLSTLLAAYLTHQSINLASKLGSRRVIILATLLQILTISLLIVQGYFIILILLLGRSLPGAITQPIVRRETTPLIEPSLRATYYSIQSLLGRLSFAILLISWSLLPGNGYTNSLILSASLGLIFLVTLILTKSSTQQSPHHTSTTPEPQTSSTD